MRKQLYPAILLLLVLGAFSSKLEAQNATLKGTIVDATTKEPLFGVNVLVVGTYKGAVTDFDGKYTIADIKPGEYTIKFSYIGYADKLVTAKKFAPGETKTIDQTMTEFVETTEMVIIEGDRAMVDLESASSRVSISAEDIKDMNTNDVQDIVKMQAGVTESPDGIQIRGARVYETNYVVDGISAKDPLSGTGFGVQVSSSSVQSVDLITGGGNAEYSDATGGVIITNIKEGGDKLEAFFSYQRDNLGWANGYSSWNTDIMDAAIGGPVPFTRKKLKFYTNVNFQLSDTYFQKWAEEDRDIWNEISSNLSNAPFEDFYRARATQLRSSITPDQFLGLGEEGAEFFAPRQDNTWSNTIKLSYDINSKSRLTFTQQNSVKINQSSNTLQIVGNDEVVTPGYQYSFGNVLDSGATYTHQAYLTAANYSVNFKKRFRIEATAGRLFVRLRADANGRPFRAPPDQQANFDARSINQFPLSLFEPGSAFFSEDRYFLKPNTGLINTGISGLWHDHYVEEYTGKVKFLMFTNNNIHTISAGWEHKEQELQWIDVTDPWVGAPLQYTDPSTGETALTPNVRIGSESEVFTVRPRTGSLFFSDLIDYQGLKATLGGMFKYWAPGQYADDAIENPDVQLPEGLRQSYRDETVEFLGSRYKARFLPNVSVNFPVTENNIMYFNYGHSMILPHPRFLYVGLDPRYTFYSDFSQIGNPALNPEVSVSYELGYKSQITNDIGVTITAFYNDRFDYIVRNNVILQTDRGEESRGIYINQDYARIRGIELGYQHRIINWFKVFANFSYQAASGKSNGANQAELLGQDSRQNIGATEEQPLAWDRPFDFKSGVIFRPDTNLRLFGKSLEGFRAFFTLHYKSGLRYTEHIFVDTADNGRPLYSARQDVRFNKLGSNWFWADLKMTYDSRIYKRLVASFSVEIKNIFNNFNATRINPVTGNAYAPYDDVPEGWRDPNPAYVDPFQSGRFEGLSPDRFMQPRQILFGITLRY